MKGRYYKMSLLLEVKSCLREGITKSQKARKNLASMEKQKKSGVYSQKYVNEELTPQIYNARQEIEGIYIDAMNRAKMLCEKHIADVAQTETLKGADITEDAKLFNVGVSLNKSDIMAIISRNKGNKTMEQLAFRYANDHNIKLDDVYVPETENAIKSAKNIIGMIDMYSKYIKEDNAEEMLEKFFSADD